MDEENKLSRKTILRAALAAPVALIGGPALARAPPSRAGGCRS